MPHNTPVVEELERAFISGTPEKRDDAAASYGSLLNYASNIIERAGVTF